MSDNRITAVTEEDWSLFKAVRLAALSDSPEAFGLTYAEAAQFSEQQWRERASGQRNQHYFMALNTQQPIGLIGAWFPPDGEFTLIAMWVAPDFRGKGIADRLVDEVKHSAVIKGYSQVTLTVYRSNTRAADFYLRQGFVFIDELASQANHAADKEQKMVWLTTK